MRRPVSRRGNIGGPFERADRTVYYRIRWFDSEGRRASECVTGSIEDAHRRLDTRLREAEAERVGLRQRPRAPAPTLSELAVQTDHQVLPTRQRLRQRIRTLALLAQWWEPALGSRSIDEITPADVRAVLARMRALGRTPATCNRALSALSVVCQAAIEWGHIEHNPCRGRELRQREGRKVPLYLTVTEAARLLKCAEPRWRPLWAVAIYAGLRWSEITALRWHDIDLEAGLIHVRASVDDGQPKSGHHRTVPIATALRRHLPPAGEPDARVFPGGRWLDPERPDPDRRLNTPRKALARALHAAGIRKRISVHRLRDTFGTLSVAAGVDVRTLQELMGHASLQTTMRYLHAAGDKRRAVELLQLGEDR